MSVHKDISKHSQKQHLAIRKFLELDARREQHIDEAINLFKNQKILNVDPINQVTNEINELAKSEIVPTRKNVTEDMIKEYVTKSEIGS
jgi:hypothetical protein